jgi:hypothetical protein
LLFPTGCRQSAGPRRFVFLTSPLNRCPYGQSVEAFPKLQFLGKPHLFIFITDGPPCGHKGIHKAVEIPVMGGYNQLCHLMDYHLRLSQNFSFWESNLGFMGKNGPQTAFSKAFPKTNRVLGKAPI